MSASYDQVARHELEEHSPYCPPAFTPRSAPGVFAQYASHLPRSPMHRRCITCGFLATSEHEARQHALHFHSGTCDFQMDAALLHREMTSAATLFRAQDPAWADPREPSVRRRRGKVALAVVPVVVVGIAILCQMIGGDILGGCVALVGHARDAFIMFVTILRHPLASAANVSGVVWGGCLRFAKAAWSGLISATVVASTLAYAAGVFKTSVDSLADHVGSLALLALSLWYLLALTGPGGRPSILARVSAGTDVRLPIIVSGLLGWSGCGVASVVVNLWWGVSVLKTSRQRVVRKASSVAYQLPVLGPKTIDRLVEALVLRLTACTRHTLLEQAILEQALIPGSEPPRQGGLPSVPAMREHLQKTQATVAARAQTTGTASAVGCGACSWTGSFADLVAEHSPVCPMIARPCVVDGCQWTGPRDAMRKHLLDVDIKAETVSHGPLGVGTARVLWSQPLRDLLEAAPLMLKALPIVGDSVALTLSPLLSLLARLVVAPACHGPSSAPTITGSQRWDGSAWSNRAVCDRVLIGEGLGGGVMHGPRASLAGPLYFWQALLWNEKLSQKLGRMPECLAATLPAYLDSLHMIVGAFAAYIIARSGWVTASLPIALAVWHFEVCVRQVLVRSSEGKAADMALAMTRNACRDCIDDLARHLQGVDRNRCDRSTGNLLNRLLSDTLWPNYKSWLASWLDHLIEYYIQAFGIEIDDSSRSVGDEPIKAKNVWGKFGRSSTRIVVQVRENQRHSVSAFLPIGQGVIAVPGDPAAFSWCNDEDVDHGRGVLASVNLSHLAKIEDFPCPAGFLWEEDSWECHAWEYAFNFKSVSLLADAEWQAQPSHNTWVRRRKLTRTLVTAPDREPVDDSHVFELFLEADWKSKAKLTFKHKMLTAMLSDVYAALMIKLTFEFKQLDTAVDAAPETMGVPNLARLSIGLVKKPTIDFKVHTVLVGEQTGFVDWAKFLRNSVIEDLVFDLFPMVLYEPGAMDKERNREAEQYRQTLTTVQRARGYWLLSLVHARWSTDKSETAIPPANQRVTFKTARRGHWYCAVCRVTTGQANRGPRLANERAESSSDDDDDDNVADGHVEKTAQTRSVLVQQPGGEAFLNDTLALPVQDSLALQAPLGSGGSSANALNSDMWRLELRCLGKSGRHHVLWRTDLQMAEQAAQALDARNAAWVNPLEPQQAKPRVFCPHQALSSVNTVLRQVPFDARPLADVRIGTSLPRWLAQGGVHRGAGALMLSPMSCNGLDEKVYVRLKVSLCVGENQREMLEQRWTSRVFADHSQRASNVENGKFNPVWPSGELLVFTRLCEPIQDLRLLVEVMAPSTFGTSSTSLKGKDDDPQSISASEDTDKKFIHRFRQCFSALSHANIAEDLDKMEESVGHVWLSLSSLVAVGKQSPLRFSQPSASDTADDDRPGDAQEAVMFVTAAEDVEQRLGPLTNQPVNSLHQSCSVMLALRPSTPGIASLVIRLDSLCVPHVESKQSAQVLATSQVALAFGPDATTLGSPFVSSRPISDSSTRLSYTRTSSSVDVHFGAKIECGSETEDQRNAWIEAFSGPARSSSHSTSVNVNYKGQLQKRSQAHTAWKSRFFALREDGICSYFATEEDFLASIAPGMNGSCVVKPAAWDSLAKGSFSCRGLQVVEQGLSKKGLYLFQLCVAERPHLRLPFRGKRTAVFDLPLKEPRDQAAYALSMRVIAEDGSTPVASISFSLSHLLRMSGAPGGAADSAQADQVEGTSEVELGSKGDAKQALLAGGHVKVRMRVTRQGNWAPLLQALLAPPALKEGVLYRLAACRACGRMPSVSSTGTTSRGCEACTHNCLHKLVRVILGPHVVSYHDLSNVDEGFGCLQICDIASVAPLPSDPAAFCVSNVYGVLVVAFALPTDVEIATGLPKDKESVLTKERDAWLDAFAQALRHTDTAQND